MEIEIPEGMTEEEFKKTIQQMAKAGAKKAQKSEEPVIFKKIESGVNQEIRVEKTFYKGREILSIRKYYKEDENSDFKPGKGVTFNYEDIDEIIEGLKLMQEYLEENA